MRHHPVADHPLQLPAALDPLAVNGADGQPGEGVEPVQSKASSLPASRALFEVELLLDEDTGGWDSVTRLHGRILHRCHSA